MPEREYSDAEIDAAVTALSDADRLRDAQDLVTRAAPSLQRVLNHALAEGGWFGEVHERAVKDAAGEPETDARERAVRTLVADETRLGMLVGVAVGFELARVLSSRASTTEGN